MLLQLPDLRERVAPFAFVPEDREDVFWGVGFVGRCGAGDRCEGGGLLREGCGDVVEGWVPDGSTAGVVAWPKGDARVVVCSSFRI